MINEQIQEFFSNSTPNIVTPFSNISMVFEDNFLTHAMLILRESNYTQIPVLDYDKKFKGLISLHYIYKKLGEDLFKNFENLNNYKVKDFINTNYAIINENYKLEDVLKLLISYNFINVISNNNEFKGIITRSSVLKKYNNFSHIKDLNNIIKK